MSPERLRIDFHFFNIIKNDRIRNGLIDWFTGINRCIMMIVHVVIWYAPVGIIFLIAGEIVKMDNAETVNIHWNTKNSFFLSREVFKFRSCLGFQKVRNLCRSSDWWPCNSFYHRPTSCIPYWNWRIPGESSFVISASVPRYAHNRRPSLFSSTVFLTHMVFNPYSV